MQLILASCRLLIIIPVISHWPQTRIRCNWRDILPTSFCFKAVKRATSLSCILQLASAPLVGLCIQWTAWSRSFFNHITSCSLTWLCPRLLICMSAAIMFLWFLWKPGHKINDHGTPVICPILQVVMSRSLRSFALTFFCLSKPLCFPCSYSSLNSCLDLSMLPLFFAQTPLFLILPL